ncbi:hypothetical protein RIR_jg42469.t1 [Rhizophagus irregularis DAOM 181602=DAOM 197198]|nr:hypothetical protein RIR_jg42469.t1 [Rhizophagus irregularis DAOM 181602=DAOM 197198]
MILFIENTILCIIFSFLKLSNLRVDHVIFRFSEKSQRRRYCCKRITSVLSVSFAVGSVLVENCRNRTELTLAIPTSIKNIHSNEPSNKVKNKITNYKLLPKSLFIKNIPSPKM